MLLVMHAPEIVVVGSLNADMVASVERFPATGETVRGTGFRNSCGGKGANQAMAAARLGGSVAMIGAVGDDAFGRTQVANLQRAGVHTAAVLPVSGQPTGTALIEVDRSGDNRIVVVAGANDAVVPDHLLKHRSLLEQAKVVLVQLEIPMDAVSAAIEIAWGGDATIVLDPAPVNDIPDMWWTQLDCLTPNISELSVMSGESENALASLEAVRDAARQFTARGVDEVIVKLGERGAMWVTEEASHHWPGHEVSVVDTTAAGDCFNGALAVALARGRRMVDAGAFAVAASAVSVTKAGAQDAMPTEEEVRGGGT